MQSRSIAKALVSDGMKAAERGDEREAVASLRQAIRANPFLGEAIDGLTVICTYLGRPREFLGGLRDAYDGGNRSSKVLIPLILLCMERGDALEAKIYFDEFQELFPRKRQVGPWTISELRREIAAIEKASSLKRLRSRLRPSDRTPAQAPAPREAPSPKRRIKTPAVPKVVLPRPSLSPIPITVDVVDAGVFERLQRREINDPRRHVLCLAAERLAMVNTIDELLCPPTLEGVQELWYQIETVRKVLRRFRGRALLCDEVGLGKTIEAGMVIKEYLLRGLIRSVLVLVPPALVGQWREEMEVKFGLSFLTTADPLRRRDPDRFWQDARLCIASLSLAKSKRSYPHVVSREFDLIVVDEAHHLKNRNTQAWKLVNSIKSRFLLLLTATPVHNSLIELHNLITLLKPGQLKTRAAFVGEFVSKTDPTVPVNEEKLRELLSDVMIRNTRALAGLRLPPRHARTVCVEPREEERRLYDLLSSLVRSEYRRGGDGKGIDRLTLRLLQSEAGSSPRALLRTLRKLREKRSADGPLGREVEELSALAQSIGSSTKLEALVPLLVKSREQTIVFVSYRATLDVITACLRKQGLEPALFHGGLRADEKDAAIEAFRAGVPVLLTTEVGGEGRNLQFCHRMVNFDLPWNPMRIEQRIGRIHRIGQERETEIWNFCARGSLEDYLLEILDKKINMFELVIGEIDMILGQMQDGRDFSEQVLDAWASASSGEEASANFEHLGRELREARESYERAKELDTALFGEDYEV